MLNSSAAADSTPGWWAASQFDAMALVRKALTAPSANWKILRAAMVIGICAGFAKVAAVGKEMVVAQRFGRSDAIDAFLIAVTVPGFVVNLVAGSLNAAFIPTYIQVRETEGPEGGQRLLSNIMFWSLALLGVMALLLAASARYYLPLLGSGFSAAKLDFTVHLHKLLLPYVVVSGLLTLWGAVLNAGESFVLPAFSPVLTPLILVALLVAWPHPDPRLLAVATVLGASMEASVLGIALRGQGLLGQWPRCGIGTHVRQVAAQYLPMLGGAALMGSTTLVTAALAGMLSSGSVAALNYGTKVYSFMLAVGTTALGTAVLPYFSRMVVYRDWKACSHTLKTYVVLTFACSLPVAALLIVYSHSLARLLFQRGAFTPADTDVVAKVQALLLLQLPFAFINVLGVRLISALQRNRVLVVINGAYLVLNVGLSILLMRRMSVFGLALGTSIAGLVCCFMIYIYLVPALRRAMHPASS